MGEPFELDCHEEDAVGFRFHPTDEELVTFYLRKKVERRRFPFEIITVVNIYKYDPWDLPKMDPLGEPKRELYFFCPRDRKYRNSARPNRITVSGFWKATGTDRCIYSSSGVCIGLKKSLVFYRGKAGKGMKTDWMMHEFRLPAPGETPSNCIDEVRNLQLEHEDANWTICKIFKRQTNPGKIQSRFGRGEPFSHSEETKQCWADSLATIPVLSEISVKEDVCEEDSKSLSLSSPISTPTSDSASMCNASSNPLLRAWPSGELSPSGNPSEFAASTPSFQRPSKNLHVNNTSTIFAMTAGEDVGSTVLSPIIPPEFYFSGHSCSLFASDQAHQETHSFGQDLFAPFIWSPKASLSLPLWDSAAFSIDQPQGVYD